MESGSLLEREVLLATGEKWPLLPVALNLLFIESLLSPRDKAGRESNYEHLLALRKASLEDSLVAEKYVAKLSEHGMIQPDRHVNPITKSVVRAALRGEIENMYLVSPYVWLADRIMSNVIVSSTQAQGFLSSEQVAELLGPADDTAGEWSRRVKRPPGQGSGRFPPDSPN